MTDGINWFYGRFKIKRKAVPRRIKSPAVRYGVLVLFVAVMVFTLKSGKKFPVLPILTGIDALMPLIFVPALWHRYLCLYGTLMNITGKFAKHYSNRQEPVPFLYCLCEGLSKGFNEISINNVRTLRKGRNSAYTVQDKV